MMKNGCLLVTAQRGGLYRVIIVNEIQTVSSKCPVVRQSPTSTVSSDSGTGVAAIGTISSSGGGKATLRPCPSGGVVD